MVDYPQKV